MMPSGVRASNHLINAIARTIGGRVKADVSVARRLQSSDPG
jgi:hypothetical protein